MVCCRARVVLEAEAQSESVRMKGEAEAFAIEAKAKAEAEQMARKADAWKDYQEAAMVDMVLETLPKVLLLVKLYVDITMMMIVDSCLRLQTWYNSSFPNSFYLENTLFPLLYF